MTGMRIANFGGMIPLVSSRLLPDNMASAAVNTHLRSGELRGVRQPQLLHDFVSGGPFRKAYRIPDPTDPDEPVWVGLLSRHGKVHANPLVNDAFNRFLKLDENQPGTAAPLEVNSLERVKDADPWLLLGVPPPAIAPTLTPVGGATLTETRAYVYTYVNLFGEEGPPSPPVSASAFHDASWNLSALVDPAFAADHGITKMRIYRTISGTQGAVFYRVAEQLVNVATYSDTRLSSVVVSEGVILESQTWAPPDDVEGIVEMPNGFFVAWAGKDIFFSEPYRPWAWPPQYVVSTASRIIGCGVVDQTLVVLTESAPVLYVGARPDSMQAVKSALVDPCIEARSIVQAPEGVYYASRNGLQLVTPAGTNSVTRQAIGRDEWNSSFVPRIKAAVSFDSQYLALDAAGGGFCFDPRDMKAGISMLGNMEPMDNIWTDPWTSEAHMIVGNKVYAWGNPTSGFVTAEWASKDFHFSKPLNFGALLVLVDPNYITDSSTDDIFTEPVPYVGAPWPDYASIVGYNLVNGAAINGAPTWGDPPPDNPTAPVWPFWPGVESAPATFELPEGAEILLSLYADNGLVWQGYVENGIVYRPTSGFKAEVWRIHLKTRVPILSVQIAETAKELERV
jgi:hypothetical protein